MKRTKIMIGASVFIIMILTSTFIIQAQGEVEKDVTNVKDKVSEGQQINFGTTIGNVNYQFKKEKNKCSILLSILKNAKMVKDQKTKKNVLTATIVNKKTVNIPDKYYLYKAMCYDIDKDGKNELMLAYKTSYGDMDIKLQCYKVLQSSFQGLGMSNQGRHIKYPYYKENISFGDNCFVISYVNKYIDQSKAKFQLVYTENYKLNSNKFKMIDQSYTVVNSPSLVDRPNPKNLPNKVYIANRGASQQKAVLEYYIRQVAKKYKIPSIILRSVAIGESNMVQFIEGKPQISFDGGIGIMQITPQQVISDINQIAYDPKYNIEKGAQELCAKWNYKYKGIIPKTDNDNRNILENWYFALWAYNGWSECNNPNQIPYRTRYGLRTYSYQNRILDICAQYLKYSISRFDAKKVFPKKGLPASAKVYQTPIPYHYGDVGTTVAENDTKPFVTSLKYNNGTIVWSSKDNDYEDFQKTYCIKIVKDDNNKVKAEEDAEDAKVQVKQIGNLEKTNIFISKINPMKIWEGKSLASRDNKYKINRELEKGEYSIYLRVSDRYNQNSDVYKIKLKVS